MFMKVFHLLRRPGALRGFAAARGGNVIVTFAFASIPMLALGGAAIDYGFATRQQAKLQAAADATTLNLCQTPLSTTNDQLNTQAKTLMAGYIQVAGPLGIAVVDPTLIVDALNVVPGTQTTARTIKLTAHVSSATFFSGFTGVKNPLETGVSQCTTPVPRTFEIALVLDNTGSMNENSNGTTKIAALQQAATNFIKYVKSNSAFSSSTKISIVPFAGAVAVKDPTVVGDYTAANAPWIDWNGNSSYHWNNISGNIANNTAFKSRIDIFNYLGKNVYPGSMTYPYYGWNWAGCVETPLYPQNVQDGQPTIGTTQANYDTLYVPYFAPDEPGAADTNYHPTPGSNGYVWNSYLSDTCVPSGANYAQSEAAICKYKSIGAFAQRNNTYVPLPGGGNADLGQNGPNWGCASVPLQRLTTDQNALYGVINKMSARGSTNIHEGLMWGWRTISPLSVFGSDAAPYNTAQTPPEKSVSKVIVLMTDGMNDWLNLLGNTGNGSIYNALGYLTNSNPYSVNGSNANSVGPNARLPPANANPVITSNVWDPSPTSARSAIDALLAQACTNAKAAPANISIYTIAFSVPADPIDSKGTQLLQNCASPGQYTLANDSNGLISAFGQIAQSIGALRISQ